MQERIDAPIKTAVDAAQKCGVSLSTIHEWAKKKRFEYTLTDGGHIRFTEAQFAKLGGQTIPKKENV